MNDDIFETIWSMVKNEEKGKLVETIKREVNEEINFKRVTDGFKHANLLNSILPSNIKIECRKRSVINYLKKL